MTNVKRTILVVPPARRASMSLAALLVLAICGSSCGSKASPYDRLCKIYEDFSSEASTPELGVKISQRVEKEIPEIYANYDVVMVGSTDRRYAALKEFARETANQPGWECEAIRKRYPPNTSR